MKYLSLTHLLIYALLFAFGTLFAHGEVASGSWEVKPQELSAEGFMRFTFQQDGSVALHISALPQDVPLYLVICIDSEQSKFAYQADEVCTSLYSTSGSTCTVAKMFKGELNLFYSFPKYGFYFFNLINCYHTSVVVSLKATLLNPGSNHLTATLVPAPTMYSVMTVVWGGTAIAWGAHVVAWWKASVALHRVMFLYPAVKVFCNWYAHAFYGEYAVHGTLLPGQWVTRNASLIAFQIIFNFLLLVLSRGWGVTRARLKNDKYYLFSILACMAIVMMFRYLYTTSSATLAVAIVLGNIGFSVTIVVYVWMGVNHIIRQLETSMYNYNIDIQNIDSHYTLIKRHRILVLLKVILITWLGLNTAAFFMNLMLFDDPENPNWIDLMNTEFLDFILFVMIACNFRLRPDANLFLSSSTPEPTRDSNNESNNVESGTPTNDGSIEMTALRPRTHSNSSPDIITTDPPNSETTDNQDNTDEEEDEVVLINKHR